MENIKPTCKTPEKMLDQINQLQKMAKGKSPKIQQLDLFFEYKEMDQLNAVRENSKKNHIENSKITLSSHRYGGINLPRLEFKTQDKTVKRSTSNPKMQKKFEEIFTNPSKLQFFNKKKGFSSRHRSPQISNRPIIKYKIEDPLPFNPFADSKNPDKVYKKAEYLSKLPVNPNIDINAIEQRIDKLIRIKRKDK